MIRLTVRLVFSLFRVSLTVRLMEDWLMIRTCPLMGCTYSRLGGTLGSPKLRLLSFRLLIPLSPSSLHVLSVAYQAIYRSVLLFPACCCVPRFLQLLRGLVPHLY